MKEKDTLPIWHCWPNVPEKQDDDLSIPEQFEEDIEEDTL